MLLQQIQHQSEILNLKQPMTQICICVCICALIDTETIPSCLPRENPTDNSLLLGGEKETPGILQGKNPRTVSTKGMKGAIPDGVSQYCSED